MKYTNPQKIQHNSCGIHLLSCQITGGLESPLSHFALINQRGDSFNLFEARQFSVLRKPYKIRQKILKSIIFQTLFFISKANFHFSGLFISLNFQVPNYLLRVHSEKAILGMVIWSEYRSKVLEPAAAKISRQ